MLEKKLKENYYTCCETVLFLIKILLKSIENKNLLKLKIFICDFFLSLDYIEKNIVYEKYINKLEHFYHPQLK